MTIDRLRERLPERTSTRATPPELAARRRGQLEMPWQGVAEGVAVRQFGASAIICEIENAHRTVLYLPGGAYRFGSSTLSVPFASRVAAVAQARVVCAEYRLAPEHPFPAALHDAVEIYEAVPDDDIVLLGDSAGGGLAMSLALAARELAMSPPKALVLLSPWLDLRCGSPTYDSHSQRDQLFSRAAALEAAEMYCQGHDVADPYVSPLLGELSGMPPTLLMAAGEEVLLGDSLALAQRLALSGVRLRFDVEPGLQHVWPILWPELPQSARALFAVGDFLDSLDV